MAKTKIGTTGHEGGMAFNEDQRGGHTPTPPPEPVTMPPDEGGPDRSAEYRPPEPPAAEPKKKAGRTMSAELRTMNRMEALLDEAAAEDELAAVRIVNWLVAKYATTRPRWAYVPAGDAQAEIEELMSRGR